jgi:SagB-type dehydrogenase family enzyme
MSLRVKDATALPAPEATGRMPVEQALEARRSVREFAATPLALADLAQLLWAAQGTSHPDGLRTAPSAGALYPLELSVVAGEVAGLAAGIYRYVPRGHRLTPVATGDRRRALAAAALHQDWMGTAPAMLVVAGVEARSARKYGNRAPRYVHMEVGCVAQNVALQAAALGLGTVMVGAFGEEEVREIVGLAEEECPLAILPVGRPR